VTGAISVDWAGKLKCCGAPLLGVNDELAIKLAQEKLEDGRKAGADFLFTACPFSHLQFDNMQKVMVPKSVNEPIPAILYTQLLGLCMGIDEENLGIRMNQLDISGVTSFLTQE
jgi:heterodisulfide reductase subunit B